MPLELGEFPASEEASLSGRLSVVGHSSAEGGRRLPLRFVALTEAQWLELLQHSENHGDSIPFPFSTTTIPASYTPAGHLWYYDGAPQVEDRYHNVFDVTCNFRSEYQPTLVIQSEPVDTVAEVVETLPTVTPAAPATPSLTITNATGTGSTVVSASGLVSVAGLDGRGSWESSTDGGATWTPRTGASFAAPPGAYSAGQIRVRQAVAGQVSGAALSPAAVIVPPVAGAVSAVAVAAGAVVTGTLQLPQGYVCIRMASSHAGWLTVYGSSAALAADASRPRGRKPSTGVGILHDPVFTVGELDIRFSPPEPGSNHETPQTNVFPFRFRNDGAAGDLVVTMYYETIRQS